MKYVLDESQINRIIKKGTFDKEEYASEISSFSYTAEEIFNEYKDLNQVPLFKNLNKFYEELSNLQFSDGLYDVIRDQYMDILELIIDEIIETEEVV